MIVTITMNPSIDISYPMDHLNIDTVNRVTKVSKTAGGKGLNVTRVLKQAGANVIASGLLGGYLGDDIRKQLDEAHINHDFSPIEGETRNCIAILHEGQQTEILEAGPTISEKEGQTFLNKFEKLVEKANVVTISGSLPNGLPTDFYVKMIEISRRYDKPVILDASGQALKDVLNSDAKPFLIKPNSEELADLFDLPTIPSINELKDLLSHQKFEGIDWVVVSLGGDGAFAKHGDTFYRVTIPSINVLNPVGSGDSTVAGMAWAIDEQVSDEELLKRGNTLGMLNAMEAQTGSVNMEHFQEIFDQIKVTLV